MRIVLDTNILVSAYRADGRCRVIAERAVTFQTVVLSEHILDELERVLRVKFGVPWRHTAVYRLRWRARSTLVRPAALPADACADRDDVPVLGTALAGRCSLLVTGDKDLLDVGQIGNCRILSPSTRPLFAQDNPRRRKAR